MAIRKIRPEPRSFTANNETILQSQTHSGAAPHRFLFTCGARQTMSQRLVPYFTVLLSSSLWHSDTSPEL